jgi:hypothetical protein
VSLAAVARISNPSVPCLRSPSALDDLWLLSSACFPRARRLADTWTDGVDASEYSGFLDELLDDISEVGPDGVRRWKPESACMHSARFVGDGDGDDDGGEGGAAAAAGTDGVHGGLAKQKSSLLAKGKRRGAKAAAKAAAKATAPRARANAAIEKVQAAVRARKAREQTSQRKAAASMIAAAGKLKMAQRRKAATTAPAEAPTGRAQPQQPQPEQPQPQQPQSQPPHQQHPAHHAKHHHDEGAATRRGSDGGGLFVRGEYRGGGDGHRRDVARDDREQRGGQEEDRTQQPKLCICVTGSLCHPLSPYARARAWSSPGSYISTIVGSLSGAHRAVLAAHRR